MNTYRAVWDSSVWLWSLAGVGLIVVVVALLITHAAGSSRKLPFIVGLVLVVGFMAASFALAPRGYRIGDGRLVVMRWMWPSTSFDLGALREAQVMSGSEVFQRGTIRTMGAGGMFGYFGWFSNEKFGKFRAFVTDRNRLVVLRFKDATVVVSPEEPERFKDEVSRRQ